MSPRHSRRHPSSHRARLASKHPSQGSDLQRAFDGFAVAALFVVAVAAALTFRDYGLGWDDYTHSQYGQLLLDFYASGFTDTRAFSFVNLFMYGGGFDMGAALLAKILPFSLFETRRLAGAIVGVIGLLATWRLGRYLGGPLAGLLALVLLAACPLYYGHMFMNPKDAPFAAAMAILLLSLVRAFEEYPRPKIATVAVFGLGLGLAIGSRILGGFAALYVIPPIALLLVHTIRHGGLQRASTEFGSFTLALLPGIVIAVLVMALLWPWSVIDPLNLFRAGEYFSHFFERPWRELFEGSLVLVPDMPRTYVPLLLALKLPEILLALGVGGVIYALYAGTRENIPIRHRATLLLIAAAATLPVVVAIVTRPAMYNGIRHFIFVIPPLAALGGLAGALLLERLRQFSWQGAAVGVLVIIAGVFLPLREMVRLHPYQYVHFNVIAGGVPGAFGRFMLDYWGLAFKQAAPQLLARLEERKEKPPTGRNWRIAVCGPHPPARNELGPDFDISWDPKEADFVMALGTFYCVRIRAPVLVEIEREGVMFARVYDIRGRSIPSLLTIPPPRRVN
ncbi:MAG: glycosyltransferase family 39 protein [Rhizobiales bacterium]|nr:glycosyltransferase family 39 protein [Hyphomicrobiales bacterium]